MNPLLTIECEKTGDVMYVHMDSEGITELIDQLTKLKETIESGKNDHLHFMTEEWAGDELTTVPRAEDGSTELVHHLKIFGWTSDKKKEFFNSKE